MMKFSPTLLLSVILYSLLPLGCSAWNVVLAGGTGSVGRALGAALASSDTKTKVTILCRNAFLAAAPVRASSQFGWLGKAYLDEHAPSIQLRDWDGGDLLDIVGQDWVGWQEDALTKADVIVHCYGGYTEQRTQACERLVRESYRLCPRALHITLSPATRVDMEQVAPQCSRILQEQRIQQCEEMVQANCINAECLKIEANRLEETVAMVQKVMEEKLSASLA